MLQILSQDCDELKTQITKLTQGENKPQDSNLRAELPPKVADDLAENEGLS